MRQTGYTRASTLGPIAEVVTAAGGSIERVFRRADLPLALLEAPDTLVPYPTADLVAEFHPDAELRAAMPGRVAPLDLRAAKRLLGFDARHLLKLEMQPWRREA